MTGEVAQQSKSEVSGIIAVFAFSMLIVYSSVYSVWSKIEFCRLSKPKQNVFACWILDNPEYEEYASLYR